MKQTSLEQKMQRSQADRVADVEAAKFFLEMAAGIPLKEYFQGRQKLGDYVAYEMKKLEAEKGQEWMWDEENRDLLTYGRVCRKIAEKHKNGENIDPLVIRAVTCRYVKNRNGNSHNRKREDKKAPESGHEERTFKRESLESRLKRIKKAKKEEDTQKERESQPSQKKLSYYYFCMAAEEQGTSVGAVAFIINHISGKDYFQALSLITGKEEDADIPETLPSCENMTIEELLDEECDSEEMYLQRIYMLLVEPFARIDAKKARCEQ